MNISLNSESLLMSLNDEQKKAVVHCIGPSLILAGAGSGKTRVIVYKSLYQILAGQAKASEILMITFTNKAAGEMKRRMQAMLESYNVTESKLGFIGTYHSFCTKILRSKGQAIGIDQNFIIYTNDDQRDLMKLILKRKSITKLTPNFFIGKISEAKNQLIPPSEYLLVYSSYRSALISDVYHEYQQDLIKQKALDFDDILFFTCMLLRRHPDIAQNIAKEFTHILVDEFQDTNFAQYELIRIFGQHTRHITAVGDFAQAIYSWRGADIQNLNRFSTDFPDAVTFSLDRNYRSTQSILNYAYSKIIQNQTHPILKLFTEEAIGQEVIEYEASDEVDEAEYVVGAIQNILQNDYLRGTKSKKDIYKEFAVLYRTNSQSRAIEEVFLKHGMSYVLYGGVRFYERKEIRDLLAYARYVLNQNDAVAESRILKLGKRRWTNFRNHYHSLAESASQNLPSIFLTHLIEKTKYLDFFDRDDVEDQSRLDNIRELQTVASAYEGLVEFFERIALVENEYSDAERRSAGRANKDGVRLMSLHSAKGLEFDNVFLVGLEDGLLPHFRSLHDLHAIEEERRLFYVGITRARKRLFVCWAKRRGVRSRGSYTTVSRFISRVKLTSEYFAGGEKRAILEGEYSDSQLPQFESNSSSDDWNW
jgi:DNA helicase II / ATP-dependent DNA helicase PcrA